jgi:hypothetical protein
LKPGIIGAFTVVGRVRKITMSDSRTEAQTLFSEVVSNLTSSTPDLTASLRKCLLACELLGWETQGDWLRIEMEGYPAEAARPNYRIVQGVQSWQPTGGSVDVILWESSDQAHLPDIASDSTSLDVFARLGWILSAAKSGYTERTDEEKTVRFRNNSRTMTLKKQNYFTPSVFGAILEVLENKAYKFAVSSYVQLKYGDLQTSIWEDYSKRAEEAVLSMKLSQHLDGIKQGIESGNPEMLRTAVLGCRNLLDDVAKHLWKDPRETYTHLPGDGADGKLRVTDDKYKNRLSAYLHQKSTARNQRKYLTDAFHYLASLISSLISFQAKGHREIEPYEARSIAINTYVVIAELTILTDLEPVVEYQEPN